MHKLHKPSKKSVNTPVRENLRFLPIRLSDKVRPCVEERRTLDFKQQYFSIWQEVWGLHKRFYGIQQQDEQRWQQFDQECEELDKRYADKPEQKFLQSLLLAVCAELERSAKNEQ